MDHLIRLPDDEEQKKESKVIVDEIYAVRHFSILASREPVISQLTQNPNYMQMQPPGCVLQKTCSKTLF